jgi:hypothetical protein
MRLNPSHLPDVRTLVENCIGRRLVGVSRRWNGVIAMSDGLSVFLLCLVLAVVLLTGCHRKPFTADEQAAHFKQNAAELSAVRHTLFEHRAGESNGLTVEGVRDLFGSSPGPRTIALYGQEQLQDSDWASLFAIGGLETVKVMSCRGVATSAVKSLLENSAVVSIELGQDAVSERVTSAILGAHLVIAAKSAKSTSLRRLTLFGIRDIEDDDVVVLARACPSLEELTVSYCVQAIRPELLSEVVSECPRLTTLKILGLNRVTDSDLALVQALEKSRAGLNITLEEE